MSVMLRGRLPSDDRDGLQVAARKLGVKKQRGEPVVMIAEVYLSRVVEKLHEPSDPVDYVLAVGQVEVLVDDQDESFARSLLATRYVTRTGKAELPFGTLFEETPEEGDGST